MKSTFRTSIILFALLFLACALAANAQRKAETTQDAPLSVSEVSEDDLDNSFYAGLSVGVPSGGLGDAASFLYGAIAGYSFDVSKCFSAGPELNYTHFVGKDRDFGDVRVEGEGFDFLGVSARADYHLSDVFGAGASYGYGTYLEENAESEGYFTVGLRIRPVPGLVIRPEVTFQNESEQYSIRVYRTF